MALVGTLPQNLYGGKGTEGKRDKSKLTHIQPHWGQVFQMSPFGVDRNEVLGSVCSWYPSLARHNEHRLWDEIKIVPDWSLVWQIVLMHALNLTSFVFPGNTKSLSNYQLKFDAILGLKVRNHFARDTKKLLWAIQCLCTTVTSQKSHPVQKQLTKRCFNTTRVAFCKIER